MSDKKKMSKPKIVLLSIALFIVLLVAAFYIYTLDYYRALDEVDEMMVYRNAQLIDNMTIFEPAEDKNDIGIIFYPGGKVEAKAYAPLLIKLTEKGYTCVLVEMPFNLAVFNINAADDVYDKLPEIKSWYLMGHSLGGAMASSYSEKNYDKLEGLILLGAYSLNDAPIDTITIYGSEDLGRDITELQEEYGAIIIEGGNHAYYGNYGEQKGDGAASISREIQQEIVVDIVIAFAK